jgi:hypothetical protein
MAEKVKKAKAPAKPKAVAEKTKEATTAKKVAVKKPAVAKKQTISEKVIATTPSHEEIALLALRYWAERGHQHGQHEQDWLRAERELMQMAS